MLGKRPVPGRPTNLNWSRLGPTALAVGAGEVVWTFFLSSIIFFSFSRYRLKYCLKGPLSHKKQPTNQQYYVCSASSSLTSPTQLTVYSLRWND